MVAGAGRNTTVWATQLRAMGQFRKSKLEQ